MKFVLHPWQLFYIALTGWLNRHQQENVEYLRTENQVLKEQLGGRRLRLSDDQRRRLAVKGRILGRTRLGQVGTLVTPDTILRWHRLLIAQKWDYSHSRHKPGRLPVAREIQELVVRMAGENPSWGYDRIQGALANLGHELSASSVGNILRAHGLEPAPQRRRQTTWKTFLKAHWEVLAAIDFTTMEVWTRNGLVTFYLLFVMKPASRRVHYAGCTTSPDEAWMMQVGRNLTDGLDGFLNGQGYVLLDRDAKYSVAFRRLLRECGVKPIRLPPQSPNLNAHLERFLRSLKEECLWRLVFFGEASLRRAVGQFLEHYHRERNHQGLNNRLIEAGDGIGRSVGTVHCRQRLGGILKYYHRSAA
jgi:putative transposase